MAADLWSILSSHLVLFFAPRQLSTHIYELHIYSITIYTVIYSQMPELHQLSLHNLLDNTDTRTHRWDLGFTLRGFDKMEKIPSGPLVPRRVSSHPGRGKPPWMPRYFNNQDILRCNFNLAHELLKDLPPAVLFPCKGLLLFHLFHPPTFSHLHPKPQFLYICVVLSAGTSWICVFVYFCLLAPAVFWEFAGSRLNCQCALGRKAGKERKPRLYKFYSIL